MQFDNSAVTSGVSPTKGDTTGSQILHVQILHPALDVACQLFDIDASYYIHHLHTTLRITTLHAISRMQAIAIVCLYHMFLSFD